MEMIIILPLLGVLLSGRVCAYHARSWVQSSTPNITVVIKYSLIELLKGLCTFKGIDFFQGLIKSQ
jgi:hypothetical protein